MAFHPFQSFRRHQKKWLAAITIMCMFIFILQFGKGDALDRMMSFIGATRGRTTSVATVYGSTVTDADLDKLRRRRELANQIVTVMVAIARNTIVQEMDPEKGKGLEEFDKFDQFTLRPIVQGLVPGKSGRTRREEMDMFGIQLGMSARIMAENRAEVFRHHEELRTVEERLLNKGESHRAEKVRQLMGALEYEMWARTRPQSETLYFGGSPKTDDLLDFIMWRHEADKLGIFLTQADIRADINREAFNVQPLEESASAALTHVQRLVRLPGQQELTIDDVYTALGDELRVYLAKSAVLGYPSGVRFYRYMGLSVN